MQEIIGSSHAWISRETDLVKCLLKPCPRWAQRHLRETETGGADKNAIRSAPCLVSHPGPVHHRSAGLVLSTASCAWGEGIADAESRAILMLVEHALAIVGSCSRAFFSSFRHIHSYQMGLGCSATHRGYSKDLGSLLVNFIDGGAAETPGMFPSDSTSASLAANLLHVERATRRWRDSAPVLAEMVVQQGYGRNRGPNAN